MLLSNSEQLVQNLLKSRDGFGNSIQELYHFLVVFFLAAFFLPGVLAFAFGSDRSHSRASRDILGLGFAVDLYFGPLFLLDAFERTSLEATLTNNGVRV